MAALISGTGPIAIDAERASGFRYSQRAYLIQMRREGSGSALLDPIALPDLAGLASAIGDAEWILHAATQDLPCLAEVGLTPQALFDTELAGRLLGRERVSLAALVHSELGETLEKGHGAADWSVRPLSSAQLRYAVLDVELLIELRHHMESELIAAQKWEIAQQEFISLLSFRPRPKSEEQWRRVSGLHKFRKPRDLAIIRSLWNERETRAVRRDIAPGRVLPDASIIAAVLANPQTLEDLSAVREFSGRGQQRNIEMWWRAIERGRLELDADLPASSIAHSGPPQPRTWIERNPAAHDRLVGAREVLTDVSQTMAIPIENLLSPEIVRRLAWEPPDDVNSVTVGGALETAGARAWQIQLLAEPLARAFIEAAVPQPPLDE